MLSGADGHATIQWAHAILAIHVSSLCSLQSPYIKCQDKEGSNEDSHRR